MLTYQKCKSLLINALPASIRHRSRHLYRSLFVHKRKPPVGMVRFGSLRRLEPINQHFGFGTGEVIDRYYMEKFIGQYADDIRDEVMEVGDDQYTVMFGEDQVTKSDVLHYVEGNPQATIVADLSKADDIPANSFDCIIIVQTLQMIYDVKEAVTELYRILKPGGGSGYHTWHQYGGAISWSG